MQWNEFMILKDLESGIIQVLTKVLVLVVVVLMGSAALYL
jgi:hypothetical protein